MVVCSTTLLVFGLLAPLVSGDCLAEPSLNDIFAGVGSIPAEGSCCMWDVCGLECPVPTTKPNKGKLELFLVAEKMLFIKVVLFLFVICSGSFNGFYMLE